MNEPSPPPMPLRRGLPLDPLLQLWAGYVTPVRLITTPGNGDGQLCVPNPARVALYYQYVSGGTSYSVAPYAVPTGLIPTQAPVGHPVCIHCRDFPGLAQADWYVQGGPNCVFRVWEYVLQPWW